MLRWQNRVAALQPSLIISTGRLFKTHFFDVIIDTVPTIENITPSRPECINWQRRIPVFTVAGDAEPWSSRRSRSGTAR